MRNLLPFEESDIEKLHRLIGNGVRNSNKHITETIQNKIRIDITGINVMAVDRIKEIVNDLDDPAVGIYLRILGDISGTYILILPIESSLFVAKTISGRETHYTEILTSSDLVALEELGETIIMSFLDTLCNSLGINAYVSSPATVFELKRHILDFILIGLGNYKNLRMVVNIGFKENGKRTKGQSLIIFDSNSVNKMLDIISKR